MPNPKDITDPTTAMNMALALMAKAFKLNYSTPTNNNQRISSNPRNKQIAQPSMNMGQDRQMQMVGGNARAKGNAAGQNENQIRCYNYRGVDLDEIEEVNANCILMANLQQASTSGTQTNSTPVYDTDGSAKNLAIEVEKVNSVNRKLKVTNADLTTELARYKIKKARVEGNAAGQNGNQIRCYNCRGVGHYARNCTIKTRRRDAAYLQTQLLIAQKEVAGIQLQAEEYDLMAAVADLDEI
nr:Gag-Pol polyprotein [Tanacetum cinerariifolium]